MQKKAAENLRIYKMILYCKLCNCMKDFKQTENSPLQTEFFYSIRYIFFTLN